MPHVPRGGLPESGLRVSVEKETRRALRWMSWWRVVTACLGLIEDLIRAVENLVQSVRNFFAELAKAAYGHEQDHARRYYALTGLDPARADGDEDRYREIRIAAGDERRIEDDPDFDEEAL